MSDYADFLRENAYRIVEEGDCLLWQGACAGKAKHPSINRQLVRRVLWEMQHGPIPAGKIVRCTCETPRCINVAHCELMTMQKLTKQLGARGGIMSDPLRSAKIAAVKRAGKQAKITQDDARRIRASDERCEDLAQRFGLALSTVARIKRGEVRREFAGNPWQGLGA